MGPRELFYADLFASRKTGCRGQLGMPGQRDQHTGCVGAYLVEHDLFDFLLFSLPDNDTFSHRNGPHAQVAVDRAPPTASSSGSCTPAAGSTRSSTEHAMIVLADHSHDAGRAAHRPRAARSTTGTSRARRGARRRADAAARSRSARRSARR